MVSTDERRAAMGIGMDHTPPPRGDAVREAGRHTARVRFLRRAMIVGSALGVSIIAIVALFDPFHHLPVGMSVASVGVDGTVVTMVAPKISGLRQDGGAYAITARQGLQDITKPNIMTLRGVDATVGMSDKTSSRITADVGVYDGKVDTMTLTGHARIKNTGGYDLTMSSAEINFKTGVFSSRERLSVAVSGGLIEADRLDITDNGHLMSFVGDINSTFDSADDTNETTPDTGGTPSAAAATP
jgi:lipopolysaccharide export system protein LptC